MTLPGGEDWILRPVKYRYIKYTDLLDGSVGLHDIALLNDMIDVNAENESRARKHAEKD